MNVGIPSLPAKMKLDLKSRHVTSDAMAQGSEFQYRRTGMSSVIDELVYEVRIRIRVVLDVFAMSPLFLWSFPGDDNDIERFV